MGVHFIMLIKKFNFMICFFLLSSGAWSKLQVSAKQAVLMDYKTQTILFEKNSHETMTPSSMTKIMTVYLVFDALQKNIINLSQSFYVSEKARNQGGSRMFIEYASSVPIEELIKGTLVSSGNDATVALAEGLAGAESVFASQMTEKARELGALNSKFLNSNGWPTKGHYTTAYDLAIIGLSTIKNFPEYYKKYYSLIQYKYNNIEQYSYNTLLRNQQSDYIVDGMKTGYTQGGGYGLIFSAIKKGVRLIGVVNGLKKPKDRIKEARTLLQWGFHQHKTIRLMDQNRVYFSIPIKDGNLNEVSVSSKEDVYFVSYQGKSRVEDLQFRLETLKKEAPIAKGDHIANLYVVGTLKPKLMVPLYSTQSVTKQGFFSELYTTVKSFLSSKSQVNREDLMKTVKNSLLPKNSSSEKI